MRRKMMTGLKKTVDAMMTAYFITNKCSHTENEFRRHIPCHDHTDIASFFGAERSKQYSM